MSDASYRYRAHHEWRTLVEVTTVDAGLKSVTHAYVDDEVPGVIRWWADDQCLPAELCKRMEWPTLADQDRARKDQEEAYAFIQEIYENA